MFSKDFTTSWLVSLSQNKIFVHCNCKKSLFFSEKDVFRAEQHLNRWARKISQPCCQWQGEKTLSRMDRTTRSVLLWHKITVPTPLAPSNKRFSLPKGETKILGVRLTCVLLESAASRRIRGASKIQHYITHKNSACARIFAEQLFRARGLPQGEIPEAASIFFCHTERNSAHTRRERSGPNAGEGSNWKRGAKVYGRESDSPCRARRRRGKEGWRRSRRRRTPPYARGSLDNIARHCRLTGWLQPRGDFCVVSWERVCINSICDIVCMLGGGDAGSRRGNST